MEYVNQEIEDLIQTNVDALKYTAIKKYMALLQELKMGKIKNLENLLEVVSLIDVYSALDLNRHYYKSYYTND